MADDYDDAEPGPDDLRSAVTELERRIARIADEPVLPGPARVSAAGSAEPDLRRVSWERFNRLLRENLHLALELFESRFNELRDKMRGQIELSEEVRERLSGQARELGKSISAQVSQWDHAARQGEMLGGQALERAEANARELASLRESLEKMITTLNALGRDASSFRALADDRQRTAEGAIDELRKRGAVRIDVERLEQRQHALEQRQRELEDAARQEDALTRAALEALRGSLDAFGKDLQGALAKTTDLGEMDRRSVRLSGSVEGLSEGLLASQKELSSERRLRELDAEELRRLKEAVAKAASALAGFETERTQALNDLRADFEKKIEEMIQNYRGLSLLVSQKTANWGPPAQYGAAQERDGRQALLLWLAFGLFLGLAAHYLLPSSSPEPKTAAPIIQPVVELPLVVHPVPAEPVKEPPKKKTQPPAKISSPGFPSHKELPQGN